MSLFYSLVSLAFQIPFSNSPAPDTVSADHPNAFGRGSFVVFWMLNWVGMSALGFPCENMAMVLGFPWSSLFLIFWVISNVSGAFYSLDLAPGFFHWGYAWPLHQSRSILLLYYSSRENDLAVGACTGGQQRDSHNEVTNRFAVVAASRTILFDTHSRIGLNFGILFAWVGVSIAFYPFASFIMRWKAQRGL